MNKQPTVLDEMQKAKRDSIGGQMFVVTFCVILLQAGLDSVGATWLPYPFNITILLVLCIGVYLVRVILSNAYLPGKSRTERSGHTVGFGFQLGNVALTLVCVMNALSVYEKNPDSPALILCIVSGAVLLAVLVACFIRNARDKKDTDE